MSIIQKMGNIVFSQDIERLKKLVKQIKITEADDKTEKFMLKKYHKEKSVRV